MRHAIAQIETNDLPLDVARSPIQSIAGQLQDVLTQRLTAYMVGLSDGRDIGRYVRSERKPHPGTNIKLRDLFSLVSDFLETEDPETIQVWFMGRNPELGDKSPANALHSDFIENYLKVKSAQEKFLENAA